MTKKYVSTYCKKEVKELPKRRKKTIKLSKAVQFSVKCRKQKNESKKKNI